MPFAGVAELVDARDLGSRDESRGGSSPSARTKPRAELTLAHGTSDASIRRRRTRVQAKKCDLCKLPKRCPKVSSANSRWSSRPPISTRKVNERLDELKDRVRINGFRPGKVPVAHLKRLYGRSAMAEVIEATVRETNNQIVTERGFKLATDPKVTLPTEEAAVEKLIAGKSRSRLHGGARDRAADRARRFQDHQARRRLASDVTDAEIDEALQRIAEQNKPFAPKAEGAKAEKDDRVTISFQGTIDGAAVRGRHRRRRPVVLIGSDTFIPGFEDQLIGIGAGETRTLKVTFPAALSEGAIWPARTPNSRRPPSRSKRPARSTVDDEFAKSLGLESLAKLREAVKERIEREHAAASRQKLKRALLDELDELHKFEPPPTLVEEEFDQRLEVGAAARWSREEDLRRRGHHRGKGQGRIPRHRRAAGAARPGAGRDRREEQHQGDRRGIEPRDGRAACGNSPARSSRCGTITGKTRRRSPPCGRRSSRKRSSISCSNSPT